MLKNRIIRPKGQAKWLPMATKLKTNLKSYTFDIQITSKLCSRSRPLLNNDDDGFIEEEWSEDHTRDSGIWAPSCGPLHPSAERQQWAERGR